MRGLMRNAWPTPEEERAKTWRHTSMIVQIVFFVLTSIAIAAFDTFCNLLRLPAGTIVLVGSIAVAELLIWRAHFWRTGVESALWFGGLFQFIFSLRRTGEPEALLVLAAAAALAGWRVRNALFGALAATLVVAYLAASGSYWAAFALAIAIAFVALAGLAREWKRPSTDMLWQALTLAMPISGDVACVVRRGSHCITAGRLSTMCLRGASAF